MSYIFAAFRRTHFALNAQLKAVTGLHASEYEVLRHMGENPGIIQVRIAERLGVDESTVGEIIRRFKISEWVYTPTSSKRSTSVALTESGVAIRSDARLKALAIEQALVRISNKPIEKLTAEVEALSRLGDLAPIELKQAEAA